MLLFNKYKQSSYLILNNNLDLNLKMSLNIFRVKSLFNHSKRLIRALILIHFYVYNLFPFSQILYRGSARYHIKLDSTVLVVSDGSCLSSYYN